jgi:hypothetical protein
LAILGLFTLVRSAGGGRWQALGACALMACDNLLLVHGRIGTLDIYVVTAMIWGVALYVRGRPLLAGLVLAVGACFKLVAPYAIAVLVLLELIRIVAGGRGSSGSDDWRVGPALRRLAVCVVPGTMLFFALLWVMGLIATPYDDSTSTLITGGPFAHFSHMLSYAAQQTSPHGPKGIASYPWAWFIDFKPINYLEVTVTSGSSKTVTVHFLGLISPPILLFAIPALIVAGVAAGRRRAPDGAIAFAWVAATWLPFAALSLFWLRTSYLYYMVIVMPGVYLAVASLLARRGRLSRWVLPPFMALVLAAAVLGYPFVPLPQVNVF